MRVAILHYWFLLHGGGENVVEALLEIFPDADVFCLFADEGSLPKDLAPSKLHLSDLSRIPFAKRVNRAIFPFYSAAVGSFNFRGYDLVISSDSAPVKDIVTPIDTIHISYCHTPGRFIWDLAPNFTAELPWYLRSTFAYVASRARTADYVAAQRVTHFVANSEYVRKRIAHYYGRDAAVVYPPVDTSKGYISEDTEDYYLSVGRLVGTKRVDILIEAFNKMKRTLYVVGTGREEKKLRAMAGPTIKFLGRVSDEELWDYYARCRAFLFAADEDFGIVPVEAQAFGRPVIAYGHGGSLETVRVADRLGHSDTGVFFDRQDAVSVIEAIDRFEAREHTFSPLEIQKHARTFDKSIFKNRIRDVIDAFVTDPGTIPAVTSISGGPSLAAVPSMMRVAR
ncbi:glycosyltransferase [Silvibacterium acidisoli]|uniref:glycosyltransferase n=1 Tax=Acidobacteriaceae bacterium ZG23-2 TaxID=2883246 RepID=UPI00406D4578